MDEQVDILRPPMFEPTGEVKSREQAYRDGDWIGTFNLWVVTRQPEPAIVYQLRSPDMTWAPNKLDVTAGGHLQAGEKLTDGLREADEELGKHYTPKQLTSLGRKLFVGLNTSGTSKNNVVDVYLTEDNSPLDSYKLDEEEVYAIAACPVSELLKAHRNPKYRFDVKALRSDGEKMKITVTQNSFPENLDMYHYKMAVLADRYFKGESDLLC